MIFNKVLIQIALVAFLTSCKLTGAPVSKEFNREGQEIVVSVKFLHPKKFNTYAMEGRNGLKGEVLYFRGNNRCDILIKKTRLLRVDDEATLTLGHELMHCLYGDYHK